MGMKKCLMLEMALRRSLKQNLNSRNLNSRNLNSRSPNSQPKPAAEVVPR